jgi:hypothetical protein
VRAAFVGAGGWSEAATGLRQALKESAGKLMGQLYDRNCRRVFAPAQAFQADALPPDRFHAEMQASHTRSPFARWKDELQV